MDKKQILQIMSEAETEIEVFQKLELKSDACRKLAELAKTQGETLGEDVVTHIKEMTKRSFMASRDVAGFKTLGKNAMEHLLMAETLLSRQK